MSTAFSSQEHRPLKKPRLGPPDVYPQEAKQKEDELNLQNVKQGFQLGTIVSDECGTEKGIDITLEKCSVFYNSVVKKKIELNTLQDSKSKKFQLPVKDNFWPAACSKVSTEAWFKDLAGSKPLASLSRKVPTFNKKEEIFSTLCEYAVPHVRAAWFIKMTAAHNMGTQDSRNRRKMTVDQSIDWTQALIKYLKDHQLQKIQDHHHATSNAPVTPFLCSPAPNAGQAELEHAHNNWAYCTRFANHMYEEGLFDPHEFLSWLIELPDKMKQIEDVVLKLILVQLNIYISDICKSVILARRLAHFCGKKISFLIAEMDRVLGRTDPQTSANGTPLTPAQAINTTMQMCNPLVSALAEFKECQSHRFIVLQLCALAQIITLKCPTAMVWNSLGDGKSNSFLVGSPLDVYPCAPSSLPMPPSTNNGFMRSQLRIAEQQIIARSHSAEVHWSSDKCQQSTVGNIMSKVLKVLDTLDQHNFEEVSSVHNMDSLYSEVFSISTTKETGETSIGDEPIINLLVDWAVSIQRVGDHRCIVVALLMERRQAELRNEKFGDLDTSTDEKDTQQADLASSTPVFQSLLMSFLDTRAPVLEEHPTDEEKQAFKNLIALFNELIIHDVFSHDAYLHMLISRGDLGLAPAYSAPLTDQDDLFSVKSQPESIKHEVTLDDEIKVDMDIHTMEENPVSFFGAMKDEPKDSPEQPDLNLSLLTASVKSIKSEKDQPLGSVGGVGGDFNPTTTTPQTPRGPSRHMVYTTHFPIPQDDCSSHEINQRMIVLYGVGKARDEARHMFKKISKEIVKLYSKRNCMDVTSGDLGKVKKKKEKEAKEGDTLMLTPTGPSTLQPSTSPNFDSMMQKFSKLSYFDQHQVTAQCTSAVLDQIKSFTAGNSTYLPLGENISFLFDLMQAALNINGLMDFIMRLLKDLVEVEKELHQKESFLRMTYTTEVCLNIVAVLRRYHSYLLCPQGLSSGLFIGLTDILKLVNVSNPINCSTPERCVLTYLYDIYTTCAPLQLRHSEIFSPAYSKMKATLFAQIQPSCTNAKWDPNEMKDVIKSAKLPEEANKLHKSLCECPTTRYSFVCNAMLEVVSTPAENLRNINDLAILCAELTAHCNSLSQEWVGVLKALCCSSQQGLGFIDILTTIDVGDLSIHDSLAIFTAMLIARHCFSLQDFVYHVALPSLVAVFSTEGDGEAESGARLSCHLLLRLFKPSYLITPQSGISGVKNPPLIRNSCDRHLLEAAHLFIKLGPMLAVLKAMLKLADDSSEGSSNKNGTGRFFANLLMNLDNANEMEAIMSANSSGQNGKEGMGSGSLSEFAKRALTEICRQDWVREKFLRNPEKLFNSELLTDPILLPKQAQQLLQMICYPSGVPNQMEGYELENKHVVQRVLQSLDLWTLRVSWLELQLLFERAQTNTENNSLLDQVSKGTINLFHQLTENQAEGGGGGGGGGGTTSMQQHDHKTGSESTIWLVAPLIAKLPSSIQGKVLKLAAQVLESGNNLFVSAKSMQEKKNNMKSKSLLSHQPFLSLVLSCLKGQDDQKECLLRSLVVQLEMFINNTKEMMDKYPDKTKMRQNLNEALQLRLSLVGGMFDTIQRNNTSTIDWALLLVQLISHDVVDCQVNSELFLTIVDMLTVLIHGTLLSEGQEKGDENKRSYFNLIKKLRRELGERNNASTDMIRQLLPLNKQPYEVITVEPYGAVLDNKGNRVTGLDGTGKRPGVQVAQKVAFNPWEVIEGHKNMPPIPWSYFGAVRTEKKMLKYEDAKRLDLYHTHSLVKPLSYYLEAPTLPPEDLEPIPEKVDKPKEPIEIQVDLAKKPTKNKKKKAKPAASSTYHMASSNTMRPFYPPDPMYQQPGPAQMWPPYSPSPQNPYMYSQPNTMPQQRPRVSAGGNSKMVLTEMIINRSRYMAPRSQMGAPGPSVPMQKTPQALRQHILQRNRSMMDPAAQASMYPNPMQGQNQTAMGHPMNQPQGQYYGQMTPQQGRMMDPMAGGGAPMMSGGFNPAYQAAPPPQAANMMGAAMTPQTGFMPGQSTGQPATGQYGAGTQRMSAGMGGMGTGASTGMTTYSQGPPMAPSGAPSQHQQSYMTNPQQQQQQQMLRQQQMLAMQHQQAANPQQQPQPGMTAMQAPQQRSVMSMRRMSSGMQVPPPPAPAPQYGSYPTY